MTEPRNTRSIAELFHGFDTNLRAWVLDRPRAYYEQIRAKLDNLPQTNYDLGCDFAAKGQWMDAAFRFRFALYVKPEYAAAHYNLGCCYLQLNKYPQATQAFRNALRYQPGHQEARFMLSGVTPQAMPRESLPQHMPRDMVVPFFNGLAADYDAFAEVNQYNGPRLVAEACRAHMKQTTNLHLVEFGCGTGLVARPWRHLCREILGVDIAHAMVNQAQMARSGDNPTFDRVLEADINALEPGLFMPGATDVLLCIDTAQFLGDLAPMMKSAAAALKPGGLFVLSVEPHPAPYGYGVNPATSRFGHTTDYVKNTAQAAGFHLKQDGRVALYAQMPAQLFVFARHEA